MKKSKLVVAAAALLAAFIAVPVEGAEFCMRDPQVTIQIAPKASITVYVTEGIVGSVHQGALASAQITYATAPAFKPFVAVTLYDFVPSDQYGTSQTEMIVSSQPWGVGMVYGTALGISGTTMAVTFLASVKQS